MSNHSHAHRPARGRRRLLTLVLAVGVCAAALGIAASPASAASPVGTKFCMDGTQTFSTWDGLSANVTDVLVNSFGGVLTLGEVDPANIGRDAVRQYYDALETSDAIGSPGVDTTIPNYVIHHIAPGVCPPPVENNAFLCYSKFQVDPGVWPVSQAQQLLTEGYWTPSAMMGTVAYGTNLGGFHLVCNPPTSDVAHGTYVGDDGGVAGSDVSGVLGFYPYLS